MENKKSYTLQTVDSNNKVIKESNLTLKEGDKIIATFGYLDEEKTKPTPPEVARHYHEKISEALESDVKVLIIPEFVELQILKIK